VQVVGHLAASTGSSWTWPGTPCTLQASAWACGGPSGAAAISAATWPVRDGHGVWTQAGPHGGLLTGVQQGTEPTRHSLDNLDGYQSLAWDRANGFDHAVLIRMQTGRQETELHRRLGSHPAVRW